MTRRKTRRKLKTRGDGGKNARDVKNQRNFCYSLTAKTIRWKTSIADFYVRRDRERKKNARHYLRWSSIAIVGNVVVEVDTYD